MTDPDGAWRRPLIGGLEAMARGDFAAALPLLASAHRLGPEVPEVCLAYGRELVRRGESGIELLELAHRRDPSLLSATAELARALVRSGDLERATEVALEGSQRHPRQALAWVIRSEVALEAGDLEAAERHGERATELSADPACGDSARAAADHVLARVHDQRGRHMARSGEVEAALFAFNRAARLDSEWASPLSNMGAAFAHLGKHTRALELYHRALELDPESASTLYNAALAYVALGEWPLARHALESTVNLLFASDGPSERLLAQVHRTLARVYRELGADARAVRALEYASHLAGAGAEIWAELARAHVRCGELGKARRAARIALELSPDCDQVRLAWSDYAALRARRRRQRCEAIGE